jgi:hypothetical protein
MMAINVVISRFVDEWQPGWVECKLTDAWGCQWTFIEKVPIVTTAGLDAQSNYPQPGVIACEVLERRRSADGREVISVDTTKPRGVESTSGTVRFDVLLEQLVELE